MVRDMGATGTLLHSRKKKHGTGHGHGGPLLALVDEDLAILQEVYVPFATRTFE